MALTSTNRLVNPRLGAYFGVFASAFVAVVILALIFDELGSGELALKLFLLLGPTLLLLAIAAGTTTNKPVDFFAAGRRVPAVYCGLGLAVSVIGGSGLVTMTGAIFFIGFDAMFLLNGALAGFVAMAILLAPFLRKFGTFTISTYLARRFDSRFIRTVSAAFICVPVFLFLLAEVLIAIKAGSWLLGQPRSAVAIALFIGVATILVCGGMRAVTWTNVAIAIAVLLALSVPITVMAL
ncbi:MAG: sodium:solute symporter, partial [Pseudomonadota bacterium]